MRDHEQWLLKAENDLKSAVKLADGDTPLLDTSVYHAQQCAEKALKGYLSFCQKEVHKSHDIALLVEQCMEIDRDFEILLDSADNLSPYAMAFRYPGIELEPSSDDVAKAIKMAEDILNFVLNKIEKSNKY